jgi:hypothetical protein
MTPVQRTPAPHNLPPLGGDMCFGEAASPVAMRALMLLSGSVHPGDASLARLDDEELRLLRVALSALSTIEPTSAA